MTTRAHPHFENDSPSQRQATASDPLRSVWVGASAGTGKTKVLIDRTLRLMLPRADGAPATPPGKILCLTFTKTAAAEMSNRIYKDLGDWAVLPDTALDAKLTALTGGVTPELRQAARRLFAQVLDTPGGLKIMTIHSFCQSVLKRFPVEAGLPPHFQMMDDQNAVEYLTRCLHDIVAHARVNPEDTLTSAFARLALYLDQSAMSALMQQVMAKRSTLAELLAAQGDAGESAAHTVVALYARLNLSPRVREEDILRETATPHPTDEAALRQALAALLKGSKQDTDKAALMQAWLEQPHKRMELYATYRRAFFKTDGDITSKLATQKVKDIYPDIVNVMTREALRLQEIDERLRVVRFAALNAAFLTVAAAMVGRYTEFKRKRAMLDFDDLIIKACDLLSEERMVPWVLFKLDEGIDHILVDEAQDTSRHQWRVVAALAEEFFSGRGARAEAIRTLFVVGDEKQSIFSFQGADPQEFAHMQDFFGGRVAALQEGWEVLLEHSFRSTRSVLAVVDGVFADVEARRGVVADIAREVSHLPVRAGAAGLVELWPLVTEAPRDDVAPWRLPVDTDAGASPAGMLAEGIAATIRGWLDKGEKLESKNRSIRPGDILILVRSRGALVETLMRALKDAKVPVAGVDRIALLDEIAVIDLLALAQFALLPGDDLTLACLLKSPLFGISEERLYELCRDRGSKSVWEAAQERDPALATALRGWIARAGRATPYEFFAEALNAPCFADAVSGRRAFYGRLGLDIRDALDEFLNRCLTYEQNHTPSLQAFTDWFLRGEAEIKREQEPGSADLVRIMTVHASKGLQAPIVFLPDTVRKPEENPKGHVRLVWPEEGGVPMWSPRGEFDVPAYAEVRDGVMARQDQEYRRLLYVALTRAEDRLYIAGHHGKRKPKDDCWYNLIANSFPPEAQKIDAGGEFILRFSHPQSAPPEVERAVAQNAATALTPPPAWLHEMPAGEPVPPVPLAPSRPDDEEPAAAGPLAPDQGWRFRRGTIVHQILEILPQLDPATWEKALAQYLARTQLAIPAESRGDFMAEVLAVVRHPDFAPIFGPGSRAEVPVVGMAGKRILSGMMDRVLVTTDSVLIVDYKTNRPPPVRAEDIAPVYLRQMAAYRQVMYNIYPGKTVKCALLWTDSLTLMPVSDKALDSYIP